MEVGCNLEHTTERLNEGLRCPWKWGHIRLSAVLLSHTSKQSVITHQAVMLLLKHDKIC